MIIHTSAGDVSITDQDVLTSPIAEVSAGGAPDAEHTHVIVLADRRRLFISADEAEHIRIERSSLEDAMPSIGTRAVIEHPHSILDARHTISLDGETAIVAESWHNDDGSEKKRYETRLPFAQLVHVVLNTTAEERAAIDARVDWRGVTAESPPRQDG